MTTKILTVTDGTYTASIHLTGNYLASSFICASDGLGGVIIHDPSPAASTFTQAMAGLAPPAPGPVHATEPWRAPPTLIARPHAQLA